VRRFYATGSTGEEEEKKADITDETKNTTEVKK